MDRTLRFAVASMMLNGAFAIYHLVLGLVTSSWWLFTLGSYYLVLSLVRFAVIRTKSTKCPITKLAGWMLMGLVLPLVGIVILSVVRDRGHQYHLIVMLMIATYAFTKVTLATIGFIKARRSSSAMLIALRNVSFSDAIVSIFALQRSMLVSFEGMTDAEIVIMNASLGMAVCVMVFILGLSLILRKQT